MDKLKQAMRTMRVELGTFVIGIFIGASLSCITTYYLMRRGRVQIERTERKADTITVRDTIHLHALTMRSDTILRYVAVRLPVATDSAGHTAAYLSSIADTTRHPRSDTASVRVPITQNVYTDTTNYTAWVSGYQPSLDSIHIYTRTQTITERIIRPTSAKRFSFGLQGGIGITPKGVQPYIGVGANFRLL